VNKTGNANRGEVIWLGAGWFFCGQIQ